MKTKIFLFVYQNIKMLELNLAFLKTMFYFPDRDIVIIDMGVDREIKVWLKNQNEYEYICAEGLENYAHILNTAIKEFVTKENIMLLNANLICLGDCIQQLEQICNREKKIGAVMPTDFSAVYPDIISLEKASETVSGHTTEQKLLLTMKIPYQCAYINYQFIEEIGWLDEKLIIPNNVMLDYSLRGISKGWKLMSVSNAFIYRSIPQADVYSDFFGGNVDRDRMKEKWGMNYFNESPNKDLVDTIIRQKDEAFTALEIGCDCGSNLMQIKNKFPKAKLFGIEINPNAVKIASEFGEVTTGNIEDYNLRYPKQHFDYIIFGDVLEHLRNPEKVISYCRDYLKPEGKIIASIPNLMNYAVLKLLIGGDFPYSDVGLLDRTHIHFFTYNEIIKMFHQAGYKINACSYIINTEISDADQQFVAELKRLGNRDTFEYLAFQYQIEAELDNEYKMNCFLPKFRSDEETIRLIVEEKKSFGSFGNDEFAIALGIPGQNCPKINPLLRDRIRQVITQTDNPDLLIGITNYYGSLERYNAETVRNIELYLTEKTKQQHMSLFSSNQIYSDTYMMRPYVSYKDVFTDKPQKRFEQLKKIWHGKHIIMVETVQTRLGVGNDLFSCAESVRRILAPAVNSFDRYDEILSKCIECQTMADLFLLAMGSSSGVLAYDLSKQGIHAVDVELVDLEYEWFLAGRGVRVTVPNKYGNMTVNGDQICDTDLPENYYKEIIADFSK